MRLALFLATCLAAAVLAPVGLAEDPPPGANTGVTAGAERSGEHPGKKAAKDNHGKNVRECARMQKSDKRTGGGHGERVRACAKKAKEQRGARKKERVKERVEACRDLKRQAHESFERLRAEFQERFEEVKSLPRAEQRAAMEELKHDFEAAMLRLREEVEAKRGECEELKERAEEHNGERTARE